MNSPAPGFSDRGLVTGLGVHFRRPLFWSVHCLLGLVACAWAGAGADPDMAATRPSILEHPRSQTVPAGGTATFRVVVAPSSATPYFIWRFLDKAISGYDSSTVTLTNTDASVVSILTLTNVGASMAGPYSVLVTNSAGPTLSSNAVLRVTDRLQPLISERIVIPDLGPTVPFHSSIDLANLDGTIERLSVIVFGLNHSRPADLDIGLLAPQGRFLFLMSDAGNSDGIEMAFMEFRDQEAMTLPESGTITGGAYRPANYPPDDEVLPPGTCSLPATNLSAFANLDPNGRWTLQVADDTLGHAGTIELGWGLDLTLGLREVNAFMVELQGTNTQPLAGLTARGFGRLQLTTNGLVQYAIQLSGLAGEVLAANIHGPSPSGGSGPELFSLNYYRSDDHSGTLSGVVTDYLGQQLWHLRRSLHSIVVRTTANPAGELRGQIVPLPLPVILEPPASQTVLVGDTVVFQVGATNAAALTYQWRLNRQPLSGATNATLVLTNVRTSQAGCYDVVVSNPAGAVASAAAELRVEGPPGFPWIDVAPGTQGRYSIDTVGAFRQPHATPCGEIGASSRWLGFLPEGGGKLILETSGSSLATVMAIYTGTNQATRQYLDCDVGDAGRTYCWWETVIPEAATNFVLEVDGTNGAQGTLVVNWRFGWAPGIVDADPCVTVLAGEAAELQVLATGVPAPEYQWQFADRDIPGATNASYHIPRADVTNAGEYRVVASNFMGSTSAPIRLSVLVPPRLTRPVYESGRLRFLVLTSPCSHVVIEASKDLIQWLPISTNAAPNGTVEFIDTDAANWPRRFYRADAF